MRLCAHLGQEVLVAAHGVVEALDQQGVELLRDEAESLHLSGSPPSNVVRLPSVGLPVRIHACRTQNTERSETDSNSTVRMLPSFFP